MSAPRVLTPVITLVVVFASMLVELRVSQSHERALRARGAVAPRDPAYPLMRWSYPGVFVAMALEGALARAGSTAMLATGVAVFVAAKALKVWAIRTLGERWTFRVFVLPDAPLLAAGPYRLMRHPNYVGVLGEVFGVALVLGARITGPLSLVWFACLLRLRIAAEERALGLR